MNQVRRKVFGGFAAALLMGGLQLAGPLQAQTRDAAVWLQFNSAPGRFTARFPSEPIMQSGKLRTDMGDVLSTRHSASDGAEATYDITYNDYPKQGVARLSPAVIMDNVRDGLVYQSQGNLVSEKPFNQGKTTGRELDIEGKDGTRYRIRLLVSGNRLYQLTALARPPARADAQKFFGAFQLTGTAP